MLRKASIITVSFTLALLISRVDAASDGIDGLSDGVYYERTPIETHGHTNIANSTNTKHCGLACYNATRYR